MRAVTRRRFAVAALASGALLPSSGAHAAPIVLKFATDTPVEFPTNVRGRQAFERIRRETNGQVDIQLFPASILGGLLAMLEQVRLGVLHFLVIDAVTLGTVVPATPISSVGFAFPNSDDALKTFDGPLGGYVRSEIAAKGFYIYNRMLLSGMRHITANPRPIQSAADLNGLKIRTPPGRMSVELFRALGAAPFPIDSKEMYTALQTHLADAEENPFIVIEGFKLFEVQRYLSLTAHQFAGHWLLGNAQTWNGLPAGVRAVIERNFDPFVTQQRRDTAIYEQTLLGKLKRRGMTVNTPETASFRPALTTYYQRWKAEFGNTAWSLLEASRGKLG